MKKRIDNYKVEGYNEYNPEADEQENKLYYLIRDVDKLKERYNELFPLAPRKYKKYYKHFIYKYIYESNRFEGNSLTLEEINYIFQKCTMLPDKTVREHWQITNQEEAFLYILQSIENKEELTNQMIKVIHRLITLGLIKENGGKYRNTEKEKEDKDLKSNPYINSLMKKYISNYNHIVESNNHPVIVAGFLYIEFMNIQPFNECNRLIAGLLLNYHLLKNNLPVIWFKQEDIIEYCKALTWAQVKNEREEFYILIAKELKESIEDNIRFITDLKSKNIPLTKNNANVD